MKEVLKRERERERDLNKIEGVSLLMIAPISSICEKG
jgi:hypothetical protein